LQQLGRTFKESKFCIYNLPPLKLSLDKSHNPNLELKYVCCLLNQDALLIRPKNEAQMRSMCERKQVSMAVIGKIMSTYYAPNMFGF